MKEEQNDQADYLLKALLIDQFLFSAGFGLFFPLFSVFFVFLLRCEIKIDPKDENAEISMSAALHKEEAKKKRPENEKALKDKERTKKEQEQQKRRWKMKKERKLEEKVESQVNLQ